MIKEVKFRRKTMMANSSLVWLQQHTQHEGEEILHNGFVKRQPKQEEQTVLEASQMKGSRKQE